VLALRPVWHGRAHAFAAHEDVDAELTHQPVDLPFRDGHAVPAQ
jgi:hypothetical protein